MSAWQGKCQIICRPFGEKVFFSISLICGSYSSRLCANSYWIFIKIPTNGNGCASGGALKNQFAKQLKIAPIIASAESGPHHQSKVILTQVWVNFALLSSRIWLHFWPRSLTCPHYSGKPNKLDAAHQKALRHFRRLMKWNILASESKIELYVWTHAREYNQLDLAHYPEKWSHQLTGLINYKVTFPDNSLLVDVTANEYAENYQKESIQLTGFINTHVYDYVTAVCAECITVVERVSSLPRSHMNVRSHTVTSDVTKPDGPLCLTGLSPAVVLVRGLHCLAHSGAQWPVLSH